MTNGPPTNSPPAVRNVLPIWPSGGQSCKFGRGTPLSGPIRDGAKYVGVAPVFCLAKNNRLNRSYGFGEFFLKDSPSSLDCFLGVNVRPQKPLALDVSPPVCTFVSNLDFIYVAAACHDLIVRFARRGVV